MDLGLRGKIAMVGGASKGLGFAVARALAGEGAEVCIASRDEGAIHRAADAIHLETGAQVLPVVADLSRAEAIAAWHEATVKTFGGVDLLFANTGGPPAGAALCFDDAAWQCAFELLLMSVIRSVRLAAPSMCRRGGGAILVGTSSSVKEPVPNLALSNVLRSGVTSLAKTLALELAPPIACSSSTKSMRRSRAFRWRSIRLAPRRRFRSDATGRRTTSDASAHFSCRKRRLTSPARQCRWTAV